MDLESLKIFCVVAAELSITRAAARLGRVQSNVTTRIQQLEADVGVELFVRTGKRMSLSTAGERFLAYAQRFLALEEEARHVVTGGIDGGALRIGCMESTAASRLPTLLAGYHTRYPATRLEITTGPSRQLLEHVRTGRLDCAFLALPPGVEHDVALEEMGLSARNVWREELLLLLPPSESSARRASDVRTRSLAAFSQGCTYRAIAEERLGIAETTDWNVQEMGSYHAMIACVSAGACVALLPKSVLELVKAPPALKTLPAGYAETCLIWRNEYDVPAFQNLVNQLRRI
ncbi:LysR family transcriptional regulator [Burkholderia cenocepacia]|jgi:DNA-binding transcriptional LysR family regulator|uniref:LysR substrate-binding domain-containing protein n=1 Tax=Burkholderia cenocepacia TaxID=95486 RepID=UPI0004F81CF9|nr:LysR substrate-binding domain-containing protein [Burkholderia cenocepacia]AIO43087.1 bacterial regulatory helix-turn-helix, lysR family protein [Burkholderia cepacia]KGC04673.1 bacterial regulatory helix-turn-helix, lysR family protein [Burkholderia cepacia]MCG0577993.1 LysR substrate-binding domain-containing protein [Burkholderia cenocepacia]MCW3524451.1 LysR family transcriptional regulator [Burkholderia cenocepacia]MCW3614673.1 LysR family transcriptional regulator [Burkholderia cenoce